MKLKKAKAKSKEKKTKTKKNIENWERGRVSVRLESFKAIEGFKKAIGDSNNKTIENE